MNGGAGAIGGMMYSSMYCPKLLRSTHGARSMNSARGLTHSGPQAVQRSSLGRVASSAIRTK